MRPGAERPGGRSGDTRAPSALPCAGPGRTVVLRLLRRRGLAHLHLKLFLASPTGQFSVCSLRALEGLRWQQQDAIRSCGLLPKGPSLGQGGEAIQNVVSSLLLLTKIATFTLT